MNLESGWRTVLFVVQSIAFKLLTTLFAYDFWILYLASTNFYFLDANSTYVQNTCYVSSLDAVAGST